MGKGEEEDEGSGELSGCSEVQLSPSSSDEEQEERSGEQERPMRSVPLSCSSSEQEEQRRGCTAYLRDETEIVECVIA